MDIRQVVVTGQNQVELQTVPFDDQHLGPDEFIVETEFSFISAGTELANYTGKEKDVFIPGKWCAYPWRSGYANVGIVTAVGSDVTRTKVGQRVFTAGPHAAFVRRSEVELVAPVPDEIDPAVAVASRMAGVGSTGIIVTDIGINPWVAVFGLGMVGNLAAQAYKIMGCKVIGVDPTAHRRDLAKECGIPYTVGGSPEEVQAAIKEITGGAMVNIGVDAAGHSSVVLEALKATSVFGQLILLGSPRVPVEANITEFLSDVHLRWITVRGALEWCLPTYPLLTNQGYPIGKPSSLYEKQVTIFDWIKRGEMHVAPLISHRMNPAQIKEAYDGLLLQPETYTGVVLDWRK